ncbi:MAG: rhamnulokinase [Candidatus Omnitrophica bacterium]|nr:rhamnulokinase [Candidatus Omnitrophota bacterium]
MKNKKFIAIDLGAESGRVMLGFIEGKKLQIKEVHRFPTHRIQICEHLFWDAPAIFSEIKTGLKSVADHDIAGIGVTTWGVDSAFIDRNGVLISLPFHYRDRRTENIMERVFSSVSKQEIFKKTGIQFMPINSLFQIYATKLQTPWILSSAHKMLFMPDLFNFWLCGSVASEFTIASTSQMLNPLKKKYKPRGDWTKDILRKLGIPTHFLPDIVPPGKKLGILSEYIREETGLSRVPVFSVCCHDTASAVFAVPASGDKWGYISSGTWSLLGKEIDQPLINEDVLEYNFTNEGGYKGKIRFLKNIMGLWIWQECRRQWETQHNRSFSYAELGEMAAKEKPFQSLIDVNNSMFLFAGNMVEKIQRFCKITGQKIPQTIGEISRTILESLALEYKFHIERMESIAGSIDILHIVGGGSQNKVLSQFTASSTGKKVVCGPVEATAIGNIGVQLIATKIVKDHQDFRQLVSESFPLIEYNPENQDAWNVPYEKYLKLKKIAQQQI